jgi:hypothetical protein
MKKLIMVFVLVLAMFAVSINYPLYSNGYGGETLGNAALAGVAGCAATEAWKGMTNAPQQQAAQPRTVVQRSEIRVAPRQQDLFDKCNARFPRESDDVNFIKCLETVK